MTSHQSLTAADCREVIRDNQRLLDETRAVWEALLQRGGDPDGHARLLLDVTESLSRLNATLNRLVVSAEQPG